MINEGIVHECGCSLKFVQKIKFTKRGYPYVRCPRCGTIVGLANFKKGDFGALPTINSFTGSNTTEIRKDLADAECVNSVPGGSDE